MLEVDTWNCMLHDIVYLIDFYTSNWKFKIKIIILGSSTRHKYVIIYVRFQIRLVLYVQRKHIQFDMNKIVEDD